MKHFFTLLYLFCCFTLSSQSKKVVLDWGGTEVKPILGELQGANPLYYDHNTNIYSNLWTDTGYANPASLKVTNIVYQNISEAEMRDVNKNAIQTEASFSIVSHEGRDQIYTMVSHPAIIGQKGSYKKIVSFDVSYSYKEFPKSQLRGLTNSLLAVGNWYRFKVQKTGVHKIDRSFLSNLGMDVNNIDPRKLKIYGDGSLMLPYLNSETQSYDLVENAIQVVGENDGSFDNQD